MKIFYTYPSLTTKGGTDRVITEKANWLVAHGHEVAFVCDSQNGRPPVFPLDPRVRLFDLALDFDRQYQYNFLVRSLIFLRLMPLYRKKMTELLMRERPDIVVTTLGRNISFLTKIKDGSKKIGEAHTTKHFLRSFHLLEQRNLFFKYLTKYFRWKMDRQMARLDAVVVLTQWHVDDWKDLVPVFVIPNSLSFYPERPSSCTSKRVIMVGRYNDAKGYDLLIPAWEMVHQRHPDWILDVYGSGELHDQVHAWVRERHLQDTILLNDPVSNIEEKYLASSICVVSSRFEGFSMVLLEAMACGVPVVSFDCPHGPRAIISDGDDGFLVENQNVGALADRLCQLIEDAPLRVAMGQKARSNVLRFSRDEVMGKWVQLFNQLLNR